MVLIAKIYFWSMFAIVDIETTGGSYKNERITEIAIFRFDGEAIVDEFSSLIHPDRLVPAYITNITGITNEMLEDAPRFYEVAKRIVEITEDCTFVAHNAAFDYNFMKQEFRALGFEYSRKQLCTVRLSRKLIPGHSSYSLGNLCRDLGIKIHNRHRAAGDAIATVELFKHLLTIDTEGKLIVAPKKIRLSGIHPDLNPDIFTNLPEAPGVYFFYNVENQLIYVGKSKQIKSRILAHFTNEKTSKAIRMKSEVVDIDFQLTGSELIALLKESQEIKENRPVYNKALRRNSFPTGLYSYIDQTGYLRLFLSSAKNSQIPITSFSSMEDAKSRLSAFVEEFNLCQKLCGLYQSQSACFHHGIGACNGACIQAESPDSYNRRVNELLNLFRLGEENCFLIDSGRTNDEKSIVWIEKGKYIGYGYCSEPIMDYQKERVKDIVTVYEDNRDAYQIIRTYLKNKSVEKIIRF